MIPKVKQIARCSAGRKEECRDPVVRPDFKSGRGCQQSLVGSTPILFRHELGVAEFMLAHGLQQHEDD